MVEDSSDMLRIFATENERGKQPEGSFPVSIDVESLYTNIPLDGADGGITAFEEALNTRKDPTVKTWYLLALLDIVLKGNIFEWGNQHYK